MNAIIYCRVSTQEQAETGFSLEAQEETCATYAERKGYTVLKTLLSEVKAQKT
ncbi:MAG: recombinase family protein [bacterium]|nr:recombinase family protein [bacterium]